MRIPGLPSSYLDAAWEHTRVLCGLEESCIITTAHIRRATISGKWLFLFYWNAESSVTRLQHPFVGAPTKEVAVSAIEAGRHDHHIRLELVCHGQHHMQHALHVVAISHCVVLQRAHWKGGLYRVAERVALSGSWVFGKGRTSTSGVCAWLGFHRNQGGGGTRSPYTAAQDVCSNCSAASGRCTAGIHPLASYPCSSYGHGPPENTRHGW